MTRSEITLNIGGRYSVKVSDVDDTVGAFKGYCALGVDTAIVIEMDGWRRDEVHTDPADRDDRCIGFWCVI